MNLTDDWKVNKLCYGKSYWCCGEDGQVEICKLGCDNNFYSGDFELEGVEEVLAVCDYEELLQLKEENEELKKEKKHLQDEQRVEDKELLESRDLLVECKRYIDNTPFYSYSGKKNLLIRINAAIGESEE